MYWGAQQRFFRQLLLGVKVPAVVKMTQTALAKGYCVVIGLQSTGEVGAYSGPVLLGRGAHSLFLSSLLACWIDSL